MFVDKDSIIINGVSMGQYLLEAKFGYHKIWGEDSGRKLNGDMTSTLIGVFPKLTLNFRKLKQNELETIAPILDSARQTTTYYDINKKSKVTMTTYAGDYEIINKRITYGDRKNESFSCAFISTKKRV